MANGLRDIKKLDEILAPHLGEAETIEDVKTTRLTALGDNYGSLMLRLEIKLKNAANNESRTLEVVAKTLPQSQFVQDIFNVQVTFRNEIAFYTSIAPALDRFVKKGNVDANIDFIPKSYGGRINLDPTSDKVDDDAVLLLENLKVLGYKNGNRQEGFDLATTKLVLDSFVKLHAYSIALKTEDPEEFESNVKPYLHDYIFSEQLVDLCITKAKIIFEEAGVATNLIDRAIATVIQRNKVALEPWASVINNDSWVNNIMVKWDDENKPIGVKLVDFQVCEYKSILRDVLFFLFTSVQNDVLTSNLDELLNHYYERFVATLRSLNVNADQYSRESYEEHLKRNAKEYVYFHIVLMLEPIFTDKPVDLSEVSFEDLSKIEHVTNISELHRKKLVLVTNIFEERGWLVS